MIGWTVERGRWWVLSTGLLVALASMWVVGLLGFLAVTAAGKWEVVDFHTYYTAANAVLHGRSPYPGLDDTALARNVAYVYPPLTAFATAPFTLLPLGLAGALDIAALVAVVIGTMLVLGVRDWRCYLVALCWRPILFGVLTGNITIILGLAAAVAWRFRDRALPAAASIGLTLAAKLFLWPLVVWLAATRRLSAALLSCVLGAAVFIASWAAIGFAGLTEYPDILRRAGELQQSGTYTIYSFAVDEGASPALARALAIALAVALLAGVVVLGMRGDDRGAFALAIAASIAFAPIVWLHYFALLLVVVAATRPRLGPAWFVPLAMWVAPGVSGTPFQKAATFAVAATTILVALLPRPTASRPAPAPSPAILRP